MSGYDFDRPFVDQSALHSFVALDREVARRYGDTVQAYQMSNSEYARRYQRLARKNNMKPPPRHGRIFDGFLVIRKLGTQDQYETWIPAHAFTDIYGPAEHVPSQDRVGPA